MPLTNTGDVLIVNALTGVAYTPYNNANAYIGVGDSTNPFDKTDTDLQASSNKTYKPMDATFPSVASGNVITFQATFLPADANYDWNEWGVFNAASGGVMLNRKVTFLGTKVNTQTWVMVGIVTVNNP